MPPEVGDRAPEFTGIQTGAQAFSSFRLSDHLGQGPVVLAFFPFAFSSTCQAQVCDLRDHLPELRAAEATAFGVSTDSPYALKAWQDELTVPFPLVSDYNREALRAFELGQSLIHGLEEHHKRACFVLDPDGIVAWAWVTDDPDEAPEIRDVRAAVERLG